MINATEIFNPLQNSSSRFCLISSTFYPIIKLLMELNESLVSHSAILETAFGGLSLDEEVSVMVITWWGKEPLT
jgi:hypothetical protein